MRYAIVFLVFGLTCAFCAFTSGFLLVKFLAAGFAIAFSGVGLAYAFIGPRAFLKQANGRLPVLSYLLFWPYHGLNWLSLRGFRCVAKENAFDEICEKLYLGCRLSPGDKHEIEKLGIRSVLDLTCEFSETPAMRGVGYRCIPLLDTFAPSVEQLADGADWLAERVAQGPVYVHCALGHGRSATFVAAYLLVSGKAATPNEAVEMIRRIRSRIGLHPGQRAVLNELAELCQARSAQKDAV